MRPKLRNLAVASLLSILVMSSIFIVLEVMMSPTTSNAQGEPTPNPYQVSHADLVATSQAQAAHSSGTVGEMPVPGEPGFRGGNDEASAPLTLEHTWTILLERWQSLVNIFKSIER